MKKLSVDKALLHAKSHYKKGEIEKAQKLYQAVLQAFPRNKRAQKGLAALNKSKQSATTLGPPQNMINQMINLYNQGQLTTVAVQAKALIEQYPNAFILWNILGAAYKGLGKTFEASESFKKVIKLNSNYADGHSNFGITLQEQGKLKEAIEAHNRAIAIRPDYAEAYNNLGNALKEQGKLKEAIAAYSKALAIKPEIAEAYYNIGSALGGVVFNQPNAGLQKTIISLLDKKSFVRPMDIASAAISLLKSDPRLKQHMQTFSVAEQKPNMLEIITDLCELPLAIKLMSVCPLSDLELENLLKKLRAKLLLSISELKGTPEELKFQSALALQCFTNEYIYNQCEDEDAALKVLEAVVKQTLSNGDQPSPQSILSLASYKPLGKYEWSSLLLVNNEIEDVFTRQVIEPNQEAQFKSILPVLGEITDQVSSKVRDQYEVSPYPRWVNLSLQFNPVSVSKVVTEIELNLFNEEIKEVEAPEILIAGCGTGQHSIGTAARFKDSNVLAVDLSLSSLSYAKRKTEEFQIKNIDYMQADILTLGKLERQFDIVQSAGVLHHMDDPVAGWKVLTDCLKPGGLMKIGLYSELARQHILEIRDEIRNEGIGSSDAAMKSFRNTLMTSNQKHHQKILNSRDFYSLSTLKDLLFHVQEHRFTIPQIQDCLSTLGLKFCGFESNNIVSHYRLANPNAGDPYNLEKWHAYEKVNPEVFAGMYQFWCQKIV
jgi:SAM-dependent methyltransferase/Flp pilus assembly protein TadD